MKNAIDKSCLRRDIQINDNDYLRIFINEFNIYYEVENSWEMERTSGSYDAFEYDSVEKIDKLLDKIMKYVLD